MKITKQIQTKMNLILILVQLTILIYTQAFILEFRQNNNKYKKIKINNKYQTFLIKIILTQIKLLIKILELKKKLNLMITILTSIIIIIRIIKITL